MKQLMLGNAAVARGAYEAGVRFVSSYPGTPSTEITEHLAAYPAEEVYCEWAPNEKVACEAAIGASIAGGRAMSCCKHVGLNVMADPVFTASYTGVNAGLVLCVADDPGMHSSQNEQDSRQYARASRIPMLEPADSEECRLFAKEAFELSEQFDTPVFLRMTTRVAHSQSPVGSDPRADLPLKPYQKNTAKFVMIPANAIQRWKAVEERTEALTAFAGSTSLNRIEDNGSEVGVICAGITYAYAKEAFGDRVNYLKLGLVWPVNPELLKTFALECKQVYVLEEQDPFLEDICRSAGVSVIGKAVLPHMGEYTAALLRERVLGDASPDVFSVDSVPGRPPALCPGCPHRGVFYVLNKLKLTVAGDIGCYTLGVLPPLEAIDTTICMGASISAAHGMAKVRGKEFGRQLVSVIGDSTFMHSGMTGLSDLVYNQSANTIIILDNSTTGMTGHQDNPLTGKTIRGESTRQADLITLCNGLGVDRVFVVDPFDLDALESTIRRETETDCVSVIIAQRPCALLKTARSTGICSVGDACIGCRKCMKIGCPALSFADGHARIDPVLCNGCGLCAGLCPKKAIAKEERS